MKIGWKLFRVACFVQLLIAVMYGLLSLISTFKEGDLNFLIQTFAFFLIAWFAAFSVQTVNEHYPDVVISGRTKSVFNWLFLLNFLLLAFLFAQFIREYRALERVAELMHQHVLQLKSDMYPELIANGLMILLQAIILYGMYSLRLLLYRNFHKKTFEFEERSAH